MTKRLQSRELAAMVDDARAATLAFVANIGNDMLLGPKLDIVNPLLWEIGHVAWFQEHFILKELDQRAPLRQQADALYDSMRVAHDDRWDLPLPSLDWTMAYGRDVRNAILARLNEPLASETDSYFYQLVTFHEDMHSEAFCHSRQTLGLPYVKFGTEVATKAQDSGPLPGDAAIPGGTFNLGAARDATFAFDNEKWAHEQSVTPFAIARAPVTNSEFAKFVNAGGYSNRSYWSEAGRSWLDSSGARQPAYWEGQPDCWRMRRFDAIIDLPLHQPVMHVNWHEANAYCAFAKRRLPTELEWEVAATGEPSPNGQSFGPDKRRMPWARTGQVPLQIIPANLDGAAAGPVDVGAFPAGDSAFGCRQMLGNVWEWTASDFLPYPGFSADAYKDYSEPWFGSRKVLRGGCWATRSRLVTPVYRNFFTPDRRDIFAGFRTCGLQ